MPGKDNVHVYLLVYSHMYSIHSLSLPPFHLGILIGRHDLFFAKQSIINYNVYKYTCTCSATYFEFFSRKVSGSIISGLEERGRKKSNKKKCMIKLYQCSGLPTKHAKGEHAS